MFKQVSSQVDFPTLEKEILKWWYESGVIQKYLHKNDHSTKKFNFLDGPITANNPMGVHHAWGRTYKDLWQRFYTMRGFKQRYRNGFDCQGLWVEVEVEKELGFKTKKDIESYGVGNFVNKCKERVLKYSTIQTDQTKRLGNFMDWDNSYFTMSDENNYAIWNFLKTCWDRGWLYKGHESIPWCPRCETAISQHEMLTEDYKELTHESVFLKLPIISGPYKGINLLVWTTTPWTIPANVAVGINSKYKYGIWRANTGECYILLSQGDSLVLPPRKFKDSQLSLEAWVMVGKDLQSHKIIDIENTGETIDNSKLLGSIYQGPFDDLPLVRQAQEINPGAFHIIIDAGEVVTDNEGTGLLHVAPGAGTEDFKLGKKYGLPLIAPIMDNADYVEELGNFSGKNAKKHPEIIIDYLKFKDDGKYLFKTMMYTHRYPACWRCKTELVWKIADEWYIAMDLPDPTDPKERTLRKQMIDVAKKITWLPSFGLDRELDWLKNMHDWLISKKNRYWGLALPIYECTKCGYFEVIGSKDELQKKAVEGWDSFVGNSPHRPWIDEVKIHCQKCNSSVSRVTDVGNPWLDAGIVPFSTMPSDWFPADFITESFPGQFKNWFYALIAMSTVLKKTNPFKTVLGYASLLAEDGRPMHKSWGNSIEFNEGADKIGADVMRWTYATHQPFENLLFGYKITDETRRQFHLIIWNIYNFFVTYANLDHFSPSRKLSKSTNSSILDKWILLRENETIELVTKSLSHYDVYSSSQAITNLVSDLSLWYVRRSRDRVGPSAIDIADKNACHATLHSVLITLVRLLAPFTPFIAEEIYRNLTGEESVHLADWPIAKKLKTQDLKLLDDMKQVRKIVELGLAARKENNIKVRQPLRKITVNGPHLDLSPQLSQLILDELNIKHLELKSTGELSVDIDLNLDPELTAEGEIRELIRQVQDHRKHLGARLDQKIDLTVPVLPSSAHLVETLKRHTLTQNIKTGDTLEIKLL